MLKNIKFGNNDKTISDFYFVLYVSRSNSHKTAEFEETSAKETRETEELKKKI